MNCIFLGRDTDWPDVDPSFWSDSVLSATGLNLRYDSVVAATGESVLNDFVLFVTCAFFPPSIDGNALLLFGREASLTCGNINLDFFARADAGDLLFVRGLLESAVSSA